MLARSRLSSRASVIALAAGAAAWWLPLATRPLSSDEGGYLFVAAQWHPGRSVYGDYFVDRPPLLIGLFDLAAALGGTVPLRLLGAVCAAVAVLCASVVGRQLGGVRRDRASILAAATAAVFTTTPLFTAAVVDGELLGTPFVLASLALTSVAVGRSFERGWRWWLAAGAAAMAAALVKQNLIDGFVFAALAVATAPRHRGSGAEAGIRAAAGSAVTFAVGAVATLVAGVAWSDYRGSSPGRLWDAVVGFRLTAFHSVSTHGDHARANHLVLAVLISGAVPLIAVAVSPQRRSHPPTAMVGVTRSVTLGRRAAPLLLIWEVLSIAGGGSYWTHYLVCLVPGLVLLVASVASARPERVRLLVVALLYAAVVGVVSTAQLISLHGSRSPQREVEAYLHLHHRPGDTAIVAFGDPAILRDTAMSSPYPELWVLPVRVLDPELRRFDHILTGSRRPTWLITTGPSLTSPGIDGHRADALLRRAYRSVLVVDRFTVYRLRDGTAATRSG